MKVLRGHMSSGSVIYVVDAVWRIKSEQDIISNIQGRIRVKVCLYGDISYLFLNLVEIEGKTMSNYMESKRGEKYLIFTEKECSPSISRHEHPEIWNKFIKIQRKRFAEQLSKNLKQCQSLLALKLLLEESGSLPCTYLLSMQNLKKHFIFLVAHILKFMFRIK